MKKVTDNELKQVEQTLSFKYEFEEATRIPSKTGVTAIAHKNMEEIRKAARGEEESDSMPTNIESDNLIDEKLEQNDEIEFPKPKFLAGEEEEQITTAKRGTIVHLCMKTLDFSKDYELQDIKDMIQNLVQKQIITEKEAASVNPEQILKFTKSTIWQELKNAKEYHKEEPFYINVPANEIQDVECDETILAQGIIDLYYITQDDKLVLLDYKTDFVKKGQEEVLSERHREQLMLYKEALENALDRKVDEIYIYSTFLGKEIHIGL